MEHINVLDYVMSRLTIGNSIREAINLSSLSDTNIANEVGVTKTTVFSWRTGRIESIRRSNLVALAKILNKKINLTDGAVVEFIDKAPNTEQFDHKDDFPVKMKPENAYERVSVPYDTGKIPLISDTTAGELENFTDQSWSSGSSDVWISTNSS